MIRTAGSSLLSGGVNGGGLSGGLRGISSNNRGQLATESDGIGSGRLNMDGNLGGDGNDGNDVENMAVDNDEDNVSEQESDLVNRQGDSNEIRHNVNDPLGGPIGNQRGNDNAEDSDPELDLLAETESDSDDNHSNQETQSAQRSVQTGATAGSDTGIASLLLFPEDESGESSQQEDEESDAAETDEHDQEDIPLTDEQLERRK